ncbi:hypothetical protein PHISCL_10291 [Aspergillus sclerotialis]|uniref:Zn(2)-C6 fungal-type domain-containing protein n=1 Tax=Aspergillus sclerotialis TaxID=2070753 RepID=A0A3A2Z2R8_9EURO|nr:hypothetical protein PHISCL_10291 [Aspergillus sclerotialis]
MSSSTRRSRLADIIFSQGFTMTVRCDRCFKHNLECRVLPPHKKCSECVRVGRRCEREMVSENEWKQLDRAREKIKSDMRSAEDSVNELSESLSSIASSLSSAILKLKRLKREQEFLDERQTKMMRRDLEILDFLDEENPPPSPPRETSSSSDIMNALCPVDDIVCLDFLNPEILPPPLEHSSSS